MAWPRHFRRSLFYLPAKFGANSAGKRELDGSLLHLFLKRQGFSNFAGMGTISKPGSFIFCFLVSRLRSLHEYQYLGERKLSSKTLLENHGDDNLVDELNSSDTFMRLGSVSPPAHTAPNWKKERVMSPVTKIGASGEVSPTVAYPAELGIELKQIENVAHYNLEKKIQPLVEFLLNLGMLKPDISRVLIRLPKLCGSRLYERIIPTMTFLESLGVDKKKWPQVIRRYPGVLLCSREKLNRAVEFLCEMGVSEERRGRILTRFPSITGCSVEKKLRPTAEYFQSLGVDVAGLLHKCPFVFGLSMETNLKSVTEFLLERGYSAEEVGIMACRFGNLYSLSLAENLIPKWEYFLTMNYPREELVKHPMYFGFSLEKRIKPRYALMKERGVRLRLQQLIGLSGCDLSKALERKVRKTANDNAH